MIAACRSVAAILVLLCAAAPALGHEIRPAYLEIRETELATYEILWKVPARGDLRLGIYVELPPEAERRSEPMGRFSDGAFIERWRVEVPGGLRGREIRIAGLNATRIDALARVEHLDGDVQTARLLPSQPVLIVGTSSTALDVARTYVALGVQHILGGVDHLLFVLGLLFLVRRRWMLVKTITSFTIAHSITLAIATLGLASAPTDALNALIALSILFLGPEIVRMQRSRTSLTIEHPWIVAFAFGLLHGFGFASGLTELGLPAGDIPLALLLFNVGVEIGQLGFVAALLAVGASLRALETFQSTAARLSPAYDICSQGEYWTIPRVAAGITL